MTQKDKATLTYKGESIDFPVESAELGNDLIDIHTLGQHGAYTYDPGFANTAMCHSSITYIDGANGMLLYRGYPIEDLAHECDYKEVCYLLLYGELPNAEQKAKFVSDIKRERIVHEQIAKFFHGFRPDAHPMSIMVGVVGALSSFYHEHIDNDNPEHRDHIALKLVAKIPTIAAMCYKYSVGEPFVHSQAKYDYAENFMHMMFATPHMEYVPNPVLANAFEKIFILHADHEQNASTTTVRTAGSTGANPFACISAGIGALWGPAHGGANEACLNMLKEIGDASRIPAFIERAKDKNDPFRLMGFGHRVYKSYDPRATIMQEICHQVLDEVGAHDEPLFKLAMELERIALEDDYFKEKNLYPNVDFYSGITLSAMGIPTNMFTVIFALARTVGWIANWMEMRADPSSRLIRPRQLYAGASKRAVKPLAQR